MRTLEEINREINRLYKTPDVKYCMIKILKLNSDKLNLIIKNQERIKNGLLITYKKIDTLIETLKI